MGKGGWGGGLQLERGRTVGQSYITTVHYYRALLFPTCHTYLPHPRGPQLLARVPAGG